MQLIKKTIADLKYSVPEDLAAGYRGYRNHLLLARVNILFAFCIVLIPLAFVFDWLIFQDKWQVLLMVRMLSVVVCLALYVLSRSAFIKNEPMRIPFALSAVSALTIAALTYLTGALESPYYAGQILIYICLAMIVPFNFRESFLAGSLILFIHYGVNLLSALVPEHAVSWPLFWNSAYFLSFSFGMVLISSVILEGYRRKIFVNSEHLKTRNARIEESKEKIDALLKSKSLFLANITHELKTPLSIVIGNADLIMEKGGGVDPWVSDNLKTIQNAAFQLVMHVDRLISVTNADDPEVRLEADTYDYAGIVRNLFGLFKNKARAEGIDFELSCPEEPVVACIDLCRIEEVLNNLVQNALKFTSRGGRIAITVTKEGPSIVTEVRDTGTGIPEKETSRIFERLYQADDVLSKQHKGIGIGLYLCKRNVALHGGTIDVRSIPGQGSVFRFTLPLYFDQKTNVKNAPYSGPERRKQGERQRSGLDRRLEDRQKKYAYQLSMGMDDLAAITHAENIRDYENQRPSLPSVLLVEDNPEMMKVMADGLADEFNLFLAFNGFEGLEKLKARGGGIDLILTDIMMPGMSGFEFCGQVRKVTAWQHIPLVFVTALLEEKEQIKGFELGATDYIVKPYNIRILKEKVSHWIARRQYEKILKDMSLSLEARLNAASRMKAIVLHELRNPMQIISGAGSCLEILRSTIPDEAVAQIQKLDKYLGVLRHGVETLSAVMDATVKIDDNLIANRRPEPVKTLFDDALSQSAHLLKSTRIELDVTAAADLRVLCDRPMLTQVFVNIIRNAVEAIAEGPSPENGLIQIHASRRGSEPVVDILIKDNGIGMGGDVQQHLFNFKFTTKRDGTGIGLHFSKMIIKLHDGQIFVHSTERQGTEFEICLPIHPAEHRPAALHDSRAPKAAEADT